MSGKPPRKPFKARSHTLLGQLVTKKSPSSCTSWRKAWSMVTGQVCK